MASIYRRSETGTGKYSAQGNTNAMVRLKTMKLILMSGNSLKNREWIYLVENALKPLFSQTYVMVYEHWAQAQPMADIDLEAAKLATLAQSFNEDYAIFAKSIGSVITLKDIVAGKIAPQQLVITGLPLNLINELGLDIADWLKSLTMPTLIIQNSDDPVGSFANLANISAEAVQQAKLKLIKIPGNNTHDYDDLKYLKSLIQDFMGAE